LKPDEIKVNISSMKMLESTLMEQRFQVVLRIMNRSPETISVNGMSFDIELNGKDFASGVSNEKTEIEPFSEGMVTVFVTSTIFGIIRQIHSLQDNTSESFQYELSGKLYGAGNLLGIPFNQSGEIDLKPSNTTI
jgi:LEA14-like dessication related protein